MARIIKLAEARRDEVTAYQRDTLEPLLAAAADGTLDPMAIIEQARADAEEKVKEAYAEGYRRGAEAGEQAFQESVAQADTLLVQAAEALQVARAAFLEDIESQVLALAQHIVARILSRTVRVEPEIILDATRAALEQVVQQERVVLRANPRDLEVLEEHQIKLLAEFNAVEHLDIEADDTIEPGGCIARTETLEIDSRLEAQLEHIINQLME